MTNALILTVIGMGVVFLVLSIIYGAIVLLGVMDRVFPQTIPAAASTSAGNAAAAVAPGGPAPEEEAAIVAALARHMNRDPQTFSVRIRPEQ